MIEDIKLACPRFSVPSDKSKYDRLVHLWASALGDGAYPPHVYGEALTIILRDSRAGDNPPTPGDIRRACARRMEQIEADPTRRQALNDWRLRKQKDREAALAAQDCP